MTNRLSLWLLILIGFCTYISSFGNQFLWDDEQFIYRNQYVTSFNLKGLLTENTVAGAGVTSGYYRPLTSFTFALDYAIWNGHPLGFHLTNTWLHIAAGVLLCLILYRLGLRQAAFWISLFFIIHPIQTEAVTYMNSRGDSLYTFLAFLGLYFLLQGLDRKTVTLSLTDRQIHIRPDHFYMLSFFGFGLSLLAKEIAIATLGLYGLLGYLWLYQHGLSIKEWLRRSRVGFITCLSLVGITLSYLGIRLFWINQQQLHQTFYFSPEYNNSLQVRLMTFSGIVWQYFRLLLWPYPLHMERSTEIITSSTSVWPWLTILTLILLGIVSWWEYRKFQSLWVFVGVSWFWGMLIPVSGIIPINGLMYEHWLYLPMVGFFIGGYGLFRLLRKLVPLNLQRFERKRIGLFFLSGVTVILISLTIRQNYIWRAPIPFYTYTLQFADSARLHNNLANAYDQAGEYDLAISEYQKALTISDLYPQTYFNLANTYVSHQQPKSAEVAYQKALQLDPHFDLARVGLLNLYLQEQRLTEAQKILNDLLEKYPTDPSLLQLQTSLLNTPTRGK